MKKSFFLITLLSIFTTSFTSFSAWGITQKQFKLGIVADDGARTARMTKVVRTGEMASDKTRLGKKVEVAKPAAVKGHMPLKSIK